MSFLQDGNIGKSQTIDIRVVLAVILFAFLATMTFVGDQAAFCRAPRNNFEYVVALLPALGFRLTESSRHTFNSAYSGEHLNRVAFPMGGLGAGMICLEGNGGFSHVSLRHRPEVFNVPMMFAALHVRGSRASRVIEGPVPLCKAFSAPGAGNGRSVGRIDGLPRFGNATFEARFPFATVALSDPAMPVAVDLTGWSPFIPGDADSSSLPLAGLEYRLRNRTARTLEGVFSFHAANFMGCCGQAGDLMRAIDGGFVLGQSPNSRQSPYIASWQVSRLFDRRGDVADAAPISLADSAEWKPIAPASDGFVNIHPLYGQSDGIVYLATRVRVRRKGSWNFLLGHDGGIRLFVDGQSVATQSALQNPARAGRTQVKVALTAGEHEILVALDTCNGFGWGIYLNFGIVSDGKGSAASEFPVPDSWAGGGSSNEGYFAVLAKEGGAKTDCAWFRGGWYDGLTMLWNSIAQGKILARPPHQEGKNDGASLYVPFRIKGRAEKTIRLLLAWYVPESNLRAGNDPAAGGGNCGAGCACHEAKAADSSTYSPWYAGRFMSIDEVMTYWGGRYDQLRVWSRQFSECFYDTTLPAEIVEAVAANLTILKSPTCLRQEDGRFWGWEGCCDEAGCCHGSCTHVWNYAQALPHLFPEMERSLRETEFAVSQNEDGHQNFRTSLPIREPDHAFHAAADGQLGGLMKLYREWRISGDTAWMRGLWPKAKRSLDYCIATWDPGHNGTLVEPHHNTYDIEFWGADGLCTSFYLGALRAAIAMGRECGEDTRGYERLLAKGKRAAEKLLWNGEYFFQRVQWKGLRAKDVTQKNSLNASVMPEAFDLIRKEGPKYQYGTGCLSDGVLGDWIARCCGVEPVLDSSRIRKHLDSVFRHNFRRNLLDHANPQRPGYAFGQEGGLLLCTWPKGGKPSLPFPYSDEVWTGFEYQVASHLIMMGRIREGLEIVRTARVRYDGRHRNPFNEYECGHWYARAMSSYGLIQAFCGARYDAVEKVLHLKPAVKGDFRAFLSTATGFGTVGIRNGKPFCEVRNGRIEIRRIEIDR
jgi:uncharacterized protein (DUF608 family)